MKKIIKKFIKTKEKCEYLVVSKTDEFITMEHKAGVGVYNFIVNVDTLDVEYRLTRGDDVKGMIIYNLNDVEIKNDVVYIKGSRK